MRRAAVVSHHNGIYRPCTGHGPVRGGSIPRKGVTMRVADKNLAEVWDQGFTVVEGFLDPTILNDARDALWEVYPKPEGNCSPASSV